MRIEVILIGPEGSLQYSSIDLLSFEPLSFKSELEHDLPVVILTDLIYVDHYLQIPGAFEFIGKKHPKISLNHYLKKPTKLIPILDGSAYSSFGQLKRSINTSYKNSVLKGMKHPLFIAINKGLMYQAKHETRLKHRTVFQRDTEFQNPLLNLLDPIETRVNLKERYIGDSEECELVRKMIAHTAQSQEPVLVLGETGTGKEVVARSIHECSSVEGPFIHVNCGAIPSSIFASELFGHKKGAFTDAYKDKKGLWEIANNGTLFLDEIGDLDLKDQVKILAVLETNEIFPLGAEEIVKVNARIIAATNKDLRYLISEGSQVFREDLYYRLSTFIVETPSLKDHKEDIPELVETIWSSLSNKKLSRSVLVELSNMDWPGNVRSLKHFLYRIFYLFGKKTITKDHILALRD